MGCQEVLEWLNDTLIDRKQKVMVAVSIAELQTADCHIDQSLVHYWLYLKLMW